MDNEEADEPDLELELEAARERITELEGELEDARAELVDDIITLARWAFEAGAHPADVMCSLSGEAAERVRLTYLLHPPPPPRPRELPVAALSSTMLEGFDVE